MVTLLEVKGLDMSYGHIAATKGIDFALKAGETISLVVASGAGKSIMLLALSDLIPKSQGNARGQILFEGEDVMQRLAHKRVERGITQVAERRAMLTIMIVHESLELGVYTRNVRRDRNQTASDLERVFHLSPCPKERIDDLAGNLLGSEQQMLAIGRVLMARPCVLLLDEPSMDPVPIIVQEIFRILRIISAEGLTILLVEQNVRQALKIAQHGCVLEAGEIVLADSGKNLLGNPRVLEAYLGG